MAEIIDLGNGYGLLKGYDSKYTNLTFPLTLYAIRSLHIDGYLNNDQTIQILLDMGYGLAEAQWVVAVDNVPVEFLEARIANARTI